MKQNYERLGIIKFGKTLLETGDLDPIYIMLHDAKLPQPLLKRWLLAYWFFYHAGVASKLARYKGQEFFEQAQEMAAVGVKTPRGAERRHFRGEACLKSLRYFAKKYEKPESAINHIIRRAKDDNKNKVQDVVDFVRLEWPLFGPWIGFKIADMLERVLGVPIKFNSRDLKMYETPTAGAKRLCKRKGWDFKELGVSGVTRRLEMVFGEFRAPPDYRRHLNAQEMETILCKWKSHLGGHYPLGKDTHEIREGLKGWGKLARRLSKHLPKEKHHEET
jgi:hypothetical protein